MGDPVGSGVVSSWRMRASLAAVAAESSRCRSRWSERRALLGRAMATAIQKVAIDFFQLIQSEFYVTPFGVKFGDGCHEDVYKECLLFTRLSFAVLIFLIIKYIHILNFVITSNQMGVT